MAKTQVELTMKKDDSKASSAAVVQKKETLVQRLCRCTPSSKKRAESFLEKASDDEKSVLEKADDRNLAVKLHELVTLRTVKAAAEQQTE